MTQTIKDLWIVFVIKSNSGASNLYIEDIFEHEIDARACEMSLRLDNKIAYIRKHNPTQPIITLW